MNKVYKVVWSFSHTMWIVTSELGKGRKKSTTCKKSPHLFMGLLLTGMASFSAGAVTITNNTNYNSTTSITDGLLWGAAATVQVDQGGVVSVSGTSPAINMSYPGSAMTAIWVNGGNLSTTNSGDLLLGNRSMLQVGGKTFGGVTSQQSGGFAGNLSVGKITTSPGAPSATLWMFGSSSSPATLNATELSFTADTNTIWIASGDDPQQGAKINVTGNMSVTNNTGGNTFEFIGNSTLDVGGNLYLDTSRGIMMITANDRSTGIVVGGDITLVNTAGMGNINDVSPNAAIIGTIVKAGGYINILGRSAGSTFMQFINATGTGVTTDKDFNISSTISGNNTSVVMGHSSKIGAKGNININSVSGGSVKLYIGDPMYGAPGSITANSIQMAGAGSNQVIFNNNQPTQPGTSGYLFSLPINGSGSVTQQSGHTTLSAVSNYTGGTSITKGLLSILNNKALSSGGVNITTTPASTTEGLDIAYTDASSFSNILSGSGGTIVSGKAKIVGNNSAYSGNWYITGTVSPDMATTSSVTNFGTGGVNIGNTGNFYATTASDFTFSNELTGSGALFTDNNGGQFNFSSPAGSNFTGGVNLSKNIFTLNGVNTSALTNSMLSVGDGNLTTVGDGTQTIGGLAFNGGTMVFNTTVPADVSAASLVNTSTLIAGAGSYSHSGRTYTASGTGQVRVSVPEPWNDPGPSVPDTSANLLQQDDNGVNVQLVKAGTVVGSGGSLTLADENGNAIGTEQTIRIAQNNDVVANGTYGFRLTTAPGDGLYVNYGLKQLDILAGKTLELAERSGDTGASADMSAKITGAGNLGVKAGNLVSLSNGLNNYTGATLVQSGTLRTDADGALGDTSALDISNGATADINGTTQTVGKLAGATGSVLALNEGSLALLNGGLSEGSLTGGGTLDVQSSVLDIRGGNTGLTATTAINNGAQVVLNNAAGAGTGDILNDGALTLNGTTGTLANNISRSGVIQASNSTDTLISGDNSNFSGLFDIDSSSNLTIKEQKNVGSAVVLNNGLLTVATDNAWTLDNDVTGSGGLTKNGTGVLTLTPTSAGYTGTTEIMAGEIALGSKTSAPVDMQSQQVNIHDGAVLSGFGSTAGNIDVKQGGTLQVDFTVGGNLTNDGQVLLNHEGNLPGNQLTVNGNYNSGNGLMVFNTELGDDTSQTDKLTVHGDTAGNTRVSVNNIGGYGARTLNGIELVQVDGNSEGTFTQTGRIVAGVYDYALVRGQGAMYRNWYLTNNTEGDTSGNVSFRPPAATPPAGQRPEPGSYLRNLTAANTLFAHRLHDRLGEPQYTDALGRRADVSGLWLRQVGGHESASAGGGNLKIQSNRYVAQLGGEIAQWSTDGLDRWHLGVMGGYANEHSHTLSHESGYSSDGRVSGYSAGLYGTWYQNDESHQGLYVDGWMLYNWFDNQVKGEGLPEEKYHSKGITASVESGYTLKAGEFAGSEGTLNTWYIQPQVQLMWMGVKDDKHHEENGTEVQTSGDGNLQSRLGIRTYLNSHNRMDNNKNREFQPYVEINWIHNTKAYGVLMNREGVHRDGGRNIGEIRTGVEGKLNNTLSVWGNVGVQMGDKGYNDTQGMLGVKVGF